MAFPTPPNFLEDGDVAIEPRLEASSWCDTCITKNESGKLQVTNVLDYPVKVRNYVILFSYDIDNDYNMNNVYMNYFLTYPNKPVLYDN